MESTFTYIPERRVNELLNWENTFKAVEVALKSVADEKVDQAERTVVNVKNTNNLLLSMPGYLEEPNYGALGCKLVTLFPKNEQLPSPMPSILGNIFLFSETTGALKAVVSATAITQWRTAAASAVATKHLHLRNPSRKCDVLAVLGAGAQGAIHARAFHHFFKFKEVRIWNRTHSKAVALANELNKVAPGFKAVENNRECVSGADVIVTATNSPEPIVKYDWVRKDVHINAIGAGAIHHSELDMALYKAADVYIDYWEGAKKELKGLTENGVTFKGEVGAVVSGKIPKPAENRITIFQSLGMPVEDCAMARMIYDLHSK